MGPSLFSDGRRTHRALPYEAASASMGPSLFSDGRTALAPFVRPELELQWGRRCSATEGCSSVASVSDSSKASMGPSLFSDGRVESRREESDARSQASMGPSLFSDGRKDHTTVMSACQKLQWGRRCSATEGSRSFPRPFPVLRLLQWGRRCSATEGRAAPRENRCSACASMGPSLFSDGRALNLHSRPTA